jgi:glycosyltransferase involved in cell wall biosynthesis
MNTSSNNKPKLIWLAVQPTPYNKYLYDHLSSSKQFDFELYYAMKTFKGLPFKENLINKDDKFVNNRFKIDFSLALKAFSRKKVFVCAGWDTPTKIFVLFIRSLFKLPYGFWTDSVKAGDINKKGNSFRFKKFLLKNATAVFTTGNFGVEKMLKSGYFNDKERLVSLPFFVPIPKQAKVPKTKKLEAGDTLDLLVLSRLIRRKGLEDAIEVINLLKTKNVNAKLYLGGVGELKEELKQLVRDKKLEDRVELLGWVDAKGVEHWRNYCDISLHIVSGMDPFPLAVLESLSFGLPVIGSNVAGSVVERVKDGVNGYVVPPSNPEIVAEIIYDKIIKNPKHLIELSHNARTSGEYWTVDKGLKIIEKSLF